MDTYDRRDRRRGIIKSAALAGGAVGAFLGRRQIAAGVLRASSFLINRYARNEAKSATFALTRSVRNLRNLTGRDLEALAREQVAEQRMRRSLARDLNWGEDAISLLFATKGQTNHWTARDLTGGAGVLRGELYRDLRSVMGGRSVDDIYRDIRQARSFASIETLYDMGSEGKRVPFAKDAAGAELRAQLTAAQNMVEREYLEHLKSQYAPPSVRNAAAGQRSWFDYIASRSGANRVTLGNYGSYSGQLDQSTLRSLSDTEKYLTELSGRHADIGFDVSRVIIDGLWESGGRVIDLRAMPGLMERALAGVRNNFQIPIIPYMRGFSPASFFPWLTGESKETFHLLSYKNIGKQIGISDLIRGRDMNVAVVGKTAIGMQFGEGVTEGAHVIGKNILGLERRGFNERVLRNLYNASQPDERELGFFGRLLGKQTEPSKFTSMRSVVGKYRDKDSTYPAEVLRRLFLDPTSELGKEVRGRPEYIGSLTSFLRTEGEISDDVFRGIFTQPQGHAHIQDSTFFHTLTNLADDSAVLNYFEERAGAAGYSPLSSNLASLLQEYSSYGRKVANRVHPRMGRGVLDSGIFGDRDALRGIDKMRSALIEEYVLGYPAGTGGSLIDQIYGLSGISEAERERAVSFVQGTLLQNITRNEGYEAAIDAFTTTPRLRKNAEWMVNNHLSIFDSHIPLSKDDNLPNVILLRGHESLIGSINQGIQDGLSPVQALYQAATGTAGRQYWSAWFTGIKDPANFTKSSLTGYFFEERLHRMLTEVGVGLGPQDMGSSFDIFKGLALKRALPLWASYEAYNYINSEGDRYGLPTPDRIYANVRANLHLLRARLLGDARLDDLMPGIDKYIGTNTYEEEKERLHSGYEPVRQGRYWLFGSRGEFMGGKVRYFIPDHFQRAYSGWEAADNADLASDDYWSHSILPNPRYPLSTVNHFLDAYWWENKHSVGDNPERPYVVSGPLFEPNTPWGPALNATVGNILKPARSLHPAYDPKNRKASQLLRELAGGNIDALSGASYDAIDGIGTAYDSGDSSAADAAYYANAEDDARDEAMITLSRGSFGRIRTAGGVQVVGPAGGNSRGSRSARKQLARINAELKSQGRYTTPVRLADTSSPNIVGYTGDPDDVQYPNEIGQTIDAAKEHMGIYGWMIDAVTGHRPKGLWMADPTHAYGSSSRFWEMNLGGLGGEISEIGRRFLSKRPGTVEWYNPVPNEFYGGWLPGDSSYINLQRGDPYCVSPDTLVETGELGFTPACCVTTTHKITTHTGCLRPPRKVVPRPVRSSEHVYRLRVVSLTGVDLDLSEEHPVLVASNAQGRRRTHKVRIQKYRHANSIIELLKKSTLTKTEISRITGVAPSQLTSIFRMLEADGKLLPAVDRKPLVLVDQSLYDIDMLSNGLRWVQTKDLQPGDYVAYPRPKPDIHEVVLDIGNLSAYTSTEQWVYTSGNCSQQFAECYEWLETHGIPQFKRGQLANLLLSMGWDRKHFENAQQAIRAGRCPERVKRYVTLDPDIAYMFGLYLSEGYTDRDQATVFCLHTDEAGLFADALKGALKIDGTANHTFSAVDGTNGAYGFIGSAVLSRVLRALFGKGAHNKTIPDALAHLEDTILVALLRGMFDGDGCAFFDNSSNRRSELFRIQLNSCNQILLLQVRKLLLRLGLVASLTRNEPHTTVSKQGRTIASGTSYDLTLRGSSALSLASKFGYTVPTTQPDTSARWSFVTDDYVFLRVLSITPIDAVSTVIGYEVENDKSFCVAGVATHNTRIPQGIMRLPGEAYERLHGTRLMLSRASSLGKSEDELVLEMLHMKEPLDEFGEYVTETDNEFHRVIQNYWRRMGLLKAAETEIFDDELGVSGHIDGYLEIGGKRYIGEIKSMSAKHFRTRTPHEEHLDQLNFYLHATGIRDGVLVYVNRDDPDQVKMFDVRYSRTRQHRVEAKLAAARSRVEALVESGVVSRSQLYDNVTRFEILADVAPYSDEYAGLAKVLADSDQLSEAQHARYVAAKKRAQIQKRRVELHPYHFTQGTEMESRYGVVSRIVDANTLQLAGGQIVRMAGVKASNERAEDYMREEGPTTKERVKSFVTDWTEDQLAAGLKWAFFLKDNTARGVARSISDRLFSDPSTPEKLWGRFGVGVGSLVNLHYSADEADMYGEDMFHSLRAVVSSFGHENINHEMLRAGVAVERENDWSAAGVRARFSRAEREFGGVWEKFAHLDTPFHTKFLRVRSPLEEYKRGHVYGTNQGDWMHPFRTYVWPTVEAYVARNPVMAGLSMGLFASMFTQTRSMKLKVGAYGAAVGAGLSLLRIGKEVVTGDPWIPKRVRKQRDVEEYWDIINYIKYRRLYEHAAEQAREQENTDVEELLAEEKAEGEKRKRIQRGLEKKKPALKLNGSDRAKQQLKAINQKIKKLSEYEKVRELGPWTTQALLYRQKFTSTMYGIEVESSDYRTIMRAIPKYEREIVAGMLSDSTAKEKAEFYRLLPDYEKRILGRALGQDSVPEKDDLEDYFRTHTLPGVDWEGWRPDVDTSMLKARAVTSEGLDPMEFGLYPQTISKAEAITNEVEVPTVHGKSSDIQKSLRDLLSGRGLKNMHVQVQVVPDPNASRDQVSVDMEVSHDRHDDLISALRGYV